MNKFINRDSGSVTILVLLALISGNLQSQEIAIIPAPVKIERTSGTFHLTKESAINTQGNDKEVARIADYLAARLMPATGYAMPVTYGGAAAIQLILDQKLNVWNGQEGYNLTVTTSGVTIQANAPAGLFYGVQTLLQLLPPSIDDTRVHLEVDWTIPCVAIVDYPRFAWRGIMFDVSRHFFPKEYVKAYIDRIARYKFNRFHWHLSDDEGWRIQIKSLPKLTTTGAWRVPRDGAYGNARPPQPGEKATDGGFYTHEDIKEIVQYARERFIEVLPEIDIPGHSMAAVASYPELSVTRDTSIRVNPGSNFATWFDNGKFEMHVDNTLNPTDEKVYQFLDKVFGEVASLFPFEYIHVGGDECYTGFWERDPEVQVFMKKHKINSSHELQVYFNRRVNSIIISKKKKMIGWDEILEGGIAPSTAVMNWHGIKRAQEATRMKHPVVMSPAPIYYLDMMQGDPAIEARVYNKAPLKDVYAFEILAPGVDSTFLLGGQANLWTEQIATPGKAEYMTYPRAFAVAESLWSPRDAKEWNRFIPRVEAQFARFDYAGVNYATSLYDPVITVKKNSEGMLVVALTPDISGLEVHYTLDNSIPDRYAATLQGSIVLSPEVERVRCITYRNGKPMGHLISLTREELEKRSAR